MGDSVSGTILAISLVIVLLAIYIHFNPEVLDYFRSKDKSTDQSSESLIGSHDMESEDPNEMSVDMVDYRHDDPSLTRRVGKDVIPAS